MSFDFPASPTPGQVYQGWSYDGEKWVATAIGPNTSGVIAIQVFTSSGTYTPSPSMTSCVIECQAGGGAGGSVTGVAGMYTCGSGGGGGAYARKSATAVQIGLFQSVTVGAGGAAAAAGDNSGFSGGTSSVGSLCSAVGGTGGPFAHSGVSVSGGGAAGTTGTGDFIAPGGAGGGGYGSSSTSGVVGFGWGGSSYFGGGAATTVATNGIAALQGGGGSGGQAISAVNYTGGAGGKGLVVITEYGMTALASGAGLGNVRYDLAQGLTTNQQAQARANLGDLKKNYVINGGMQISQENGATVLTATSVYPVDMFGFAGTYGAWQTAQTSSLTPGGSPNRVQVQVTTADTAMTGAKYALLFVALEGLRMADLKAGTAAAKQITVQFGVKAPAGTYCVSLQNGPTANRSYIAEYVIAAGEANTDVVKSVTLTLNDTVGTWVNNNTAGLWVNFTLGVGPTGQGVANSWLAGGFFGTSNQFNFMGTVNNVFELFDVGLYEGTAAPPFMVPDYASELELCMRYYEKAPTSTAIAMNAGYAGVQWKIVKRANPTVVFLPDSGTVTGTTPSTFGAVASFSTLTGFGYTASARL